MLFLLLYLCLYSALGQPGTPGLNRLMLKGKSYPCSGRVDIYDKGMWKHVGNRDWNESNSEVVCKSLQCGEVVNTTTQYEEDRYPYTSAWANFLKCTGQETQLWQCSHPKDTWAPPYEHVYVTCSENPKLSLIGLDGKDGCAGFVHLSTKQSYTLCVEDKDKQKFAEQVCKELSCGEPTTSPNQFVFKDQGKPKQNYKCVGGEDFLWQCIDWSSRGACREPVSVICSKHLHFRLKGDKANFCSGKLEEFNSPTWRPVNSERYGDISKNWTASVICEQLDCGNSGRSQENDTSTTVSLSCSDEVGMTLEGGECHGTIYLHRNKSKKQPVCADHSNDKIGQLVCKEMGCGEFIKTYDDNGPSRQSNWWTLSCKDHAESLWHCGRTQARSCGQQKSAIICSESFKVRLRDGLDECSGRLEVLYKGSWGRVLSDNWARRHSDTVCSHLGCGGGYTEGSDLFIDGDNSNDSPLELTVGQSCGPNDHLLKCLTERGNTQNQKEFIKVICQDQHLFFVNGNSPCSGTVGVELAGKTYALSGDNESWNDSAAHYICGRMQCGQMISFSFANQTGSGWMQLRRQTLNGTSGRPYRLQPASPNTTIVAEVNCTGSVTLALKNKGDGANEEMSKDRCWGNVEVCRNGKCGGVCRDVWTEKHSEKLCANLGCGGPVVTNQPEQSVALDVAFSSVHCPSTVSDLSGCSYVLNNGSRCAEEKTVYVVCSGSLKAKLIDPRDKCAGTAEVYLAGRWLPLCGSLDKNIQNSVCNYVGCGVARDSTVTTSSSTPEGLTTRCVKDSTSIQNCTDMRLSKPCTAARVNCSSWRRLVVFSGETECGGPVFVKTESSKLFAVSAHPWKSTEVNLLCSNLGCSGQGVGHSKTVSMQNWWNKTYSCHNGAQSIWDCEKEEQQVEKQQLYISCKGQKNVSLANGCYGKVMIDNTENACFSGWTAHMSKMVCYNRGCTDQFSHIQSSSAPGHLRHFSCTGSESKLMECASSQTLCSQGPVSVMCRGAFDFNLTEHCGGQIRVFQHGKWEPACLKKDGGETANHLCKRFNCGQVNNSKINYGKPESTKKDIKAVLSCNGITKLEDCVTESFCGNDDLDEIYCDGFVEKSAPRELPINLIVGVAVGLLLLVIIIPLVLWQRRRITKLLRGLSRTTPTFASDDFEDVEIRLKGETHIRLENQANGREKGLESKSSSEYDDVDEEAEGQRELTAVSSPGVGNADEAPPLPARDVEQDGDRDADDDYTEGYDDVADPPMEKEPEEQSEEHGAPSQQKESKPLMEEDEDYVQPDDDA